MAMKRVLTMITAAGVMLLGARALAADPAGHAKNSRRQLVGCVIKRMSASRTVSYNEATKACKEQLKPQNDDLASNTPTKPVNGR
jgi:hypothetical protein